MIQDKPVGIYASALLAGANFVLGSVVSSRRMSSRKSIGCDENDPNSDLTKAVRAHANHAEYTPTIIALMLFIESKAMYAPQGSVDINVLHWLRFGMIGYVLGRISITCGLMSKNSLNQVSPFRRLGAMMNYLFGILLAGGIIYV